MSWIDDKATAGLSMIREVQKVNMYPHFRPFESGGLHTSATAYCGTLVTSKRTTSLTVFVFSSSTQTS